MGVCARAAVARIIWQTWCRSSEGHRRLRDYATSWDSPVGERAGGRRRAGRTKQKPSSTEQDKSSQTLDKAVRASGHLRANRRPPGGVVSSGTRGRWSAGNVYGTESSTRANKDVRNWTLSSIVSGWQVRARLVILWRGLRSDLFAP